MVDVEQSALRSFTEHLLARLERGVDRIDRIADAGSEVGGRLPDALPFGIDVELRNPVLGEKFVVLRRLGAELRFQPLGSGEIDRADAAAVHLVGIGRTDAALGRADLLRTGAGFVEHISPLVIFEDQLGAVAQLDRGDVESLFGDALHFLGQRDRINHQPVADDAADPLAEDAGGNEVEHVALTADFNGVSGVVAALEANHHIDVTGEHVDELSLAFVTPLGPDQNINRHIFSPV